MATAKKVTAKKAPAKKTAARKAAPKTSAKKSADFSLRDSAEKAVNVYLGVIGKGLDMVQENMETTRKENDKRVKDLEKRGLKLRKELNKRFDDIEAPAAFEEVVDDVKAQFNKVQDQVEDAVETVKEKLVPAKAA